MTRHDVIAMAGCSLVLLAITWGFLAGLLLMLKGLLWLAEAIL